MVKTLAKQVFTAVLGRRHRRLVAEPRRVRIFRYGGIGDLVALTGLLRSLQRWNPKLEITLVTRPGMGALFEHTDFPLRVVTMKAPTDAMTWREWRHWRRVLDGDPHDLELFLHNDVKSVLFARSLRSSFMFGFDSDEQGYGRLFDASLSVYSTAFAGRTGRQPPVVHVRDLFHRAAELALSASLPRLSVRLNSTADEQEAFRRKYMLGRKSRLIAVLPCGTEGIKVWPTGNYVELVRRIAREFDAIVLVVGGAPESAKAPAFAGLKDVMFLAGKLSLRESLAALAQSGVVVGNDTGMMHAAVALGCRTVAIFGPTSRTAFGYQGANNRILQGDYPCVPCHLRSCALRKGEADWTLKSGLCMEAVPAAQVFDAVREMLGPSFRPLIN